MKGDLEFVVYQIGASPHAADCSSVVLLTRLLQSYFCRGIFQEERTFADVLAQGGESGGRSGP